MEGGIVRVKCRTQDDKTMYPARARFRTARSRYERTNHEATAPPTPTKGSGKKAEPKSRRGKYSAWCVNTIYRLLYTHKSVIFLNPASVPFLMVVNCLSSILFMFLQIQKIT